MKHKIPLLVLGIAAVVSFAIFAPMVNAQAAGSSTQLGIPPSLITYHLQHPGVNCVEGTLDPFTIQPCPTYPPGTILSPIQGYPILINGSSPNTA
jgi:hypothetical protein